MLTRKLGNSDLHITPIGFGAWAIGGGDWAFGWGKQDDADSIACIHAALDAGINWIDTAAIYGLGHSEEVVAKALAGMKQKPYVFTKCARVWDANRQIGKCLKRESIRRECEASLKRLQVEKIDLYQVHWPEPDEDVEEGWAAVKELQTEGKVRWIGFSGYPQKIFRFICDQTNVDCVLSYNQYTLQNTRFADETIPYLQAKGVGVMNAGPFSARLLTNAPLPAWLKEPEPVKAAARQAAALCASRGVDIAQLALQFSLAHPGIATTIAGSANPQNIENWARWAALPLDPQLLAEVQAIFAPVKNIGHVEGLPENNA